MLLHSTLLVPALRLVAMTSTGLSHTSSVDLPIAIHLLYRLLHSLHAEKQATEHVLSRAAGIACAPATEPVAPGLLPGGWEVRVPAHAVNAAIVQPALLTDGECRMEAKGTGTMCICAEGERR